ncbi:MAG TPA: PQQ-binding-like beta-propeller repeat protein, partial [Gemmataceae bacterium]|nr:PQQ-binding-like beta-propeller repeat protein [Gemmataceae bacterium]
MPVCKAWARLGVFAVTALLLTLPRADAVITRLTPLREVLNSEQLIFSVKVDQLDPDKPSVTLKLDETLKGKVPFEKLPINLTGDSEGQREQHTSKLLKRLAKDLDLVIFTSKRGKRYTAFGYTNGTWFQVIGQAEDDSARVRWSFTHCEPYLRRTFKGTTDELKQVIRDGLANKKQPPEPNAKEEPGLGPEIEQKPKENQNVAGRRQRSLLGAEYAGPLFAVIPTFVIVGPIAVLAALFPAIFGGLALLLRRWVVLLTIASINSTLFFLHAWFGPSFGESWWGTQTALWGTMTVVTLGGLVWSWSRNRQAMKLNPEIGLQPPQRVERILLTVVSILGIAIVLFALVRGKLFNPPWKEMLVIWCVAWVGAIYTLYLHARLKHKTATRPYPASEAVMLCTLALACGGWSFTTLPRQTSQDVQVLWTFKPGERGAILSSPLLDGSTRVYVGAIHSAGLSSYGAVYRVDRATGKEVWKFDDEGGMQQVFSTPCADERRLFIGEGLHENRGCRFFCLDRDTGKELWHFETQSHTESSPCVSQGRVFFGAGDDGLYCLDVVTGKELWRFAEPLHIDADPLVVGDRLYCGSGTSRSHKTTRIFCLDVSTGKPHWQHDTDLAAWGSP